MKQYPNMRYPYAIYQMGCAFFGIGDSPTTALRDANDWTDHKLHWHDLREDPTDGEFTLVRITQGLATAIEKHGGAIASEPLGYIRGVRLYGTPNEADE